MKKNVMLVVAAILLTVSASVAQERANRRPMGTPEERAKISVERLTKALTLDQKQQDSIYKYTLIQVTEQQAIFQDESSDRQQKMDKLTGLREKYELKFKAFLSADQKIQYDKLQKERQERGPRQKPTND